MNISLCMIVRDEEKTLARCLDSVKDIVDEIIIVDTGSTDQTKEIAKGYTDLLYDFEWVDDFSVARNYAFSKGTQEYLMWLDADDVILPEDRQQLLELKKTIDPNIDCIIMKYNLTSREDGQISSSFYRERIVKRNKGFKWHDPIHEYIYYAGNVQKVDIAITHKKIDLPTRRNLEIIEKYIANGNELSERNWFYYARELFRVGEIDKAMVYYNKFLDTNKGLNSNYLDSCIELSSCYDNKKDDINSLKTLLRYFEKDGPRAEICCKLGYYYKDREQYEKAIEWFKLAPYTSKPNSLGAIMPHYWDYVPYMELCSCYYRLGKIDEAIKYNEKAAISRPNNSKICHNRSFLSAIKEKMIKQ